MMGDPVGGRWSLWRTTNAGLNWDSTGMYLQQIGAEAGWNNSMSTNNSFGSNVWFGTNNSKIYYSSNFGSSWIAKPVSELNTYSVCFPYLTNREGLTGGTNLLRTTNFGTTWTTLSTLGVGNFGGITGGPFFIPDNSGFVKTFYVRSDNKIYISTNNGTSWTLQYTAPAGVYRYIASNTYGLELWGVRENGRISHYEFYTGINQISSEIPDRFSLSQNYPNPFNPTTNLKFACPPARQGILHLEFVSLKVYDISGKEIADLVNEKKSAGTYSVEFDGSDFTSGIYFYTLTAGDYRETKKMMLIK
ncbi:MAG: T9SS type A sorting domain-containing protein, partial [Ignavibacteria bacterium]|nr:T9SS type A sorting domain-containing protein [Ignavibacteria bacterium]